MTAVELKNLDKVFWPKEGFTKGDVVAFYDRMSSLILPYLRDRPMVLVRHPNGIKGASFFQKNVASIHLPSFVRTVGIRARSTGRNVQYVMCNNKATLLYLANLGCIEMHAWGSRTGKLRFPDYMVIDLDPGGNSFADVAAVARETRKVIAAAGGTSLVKTSGKRGIHVYVPLRPPLRFRRGEVGGKACRGNRPRPAAEADQHLSETEQAEEPGLSGLCPQRLRSDHRCALFVAGLRQGDRFDTAGLARSDGSLQSGAPSLAVDGEAGADER